MILLISQRHAAVFSADWLIFDDITPLLRHYISSPLATPLAFAITPLSRYWYFRHFAISPHYAILMPPPLFSLPYFEAPPISLRYFADCAIMASLLSRRFRISSLCCRLSAAIFSIAAAFFYFSPIFRWLRHYWFTPTLHLPAISLAGWYADYWYAAIHITPLLFSLRWLMPLPPRLLRWAIADDWLSIFHYAAADITLFTLQAELLRQRRCRQRYSFSPLAARTPRWYCHYVTLIRRHWWPLRHATALPLRRWCRDAITPDSLLLSLDSLRQRQLFSPSASQPYFAIYG